MSTVTQLAPEALQLQIPGMDGYRATKLTISMSGAVDLDTTSREDLDFLNELRLGQQVELKVQAIVTKKGFTLTPGDEKPDTTGYGVGLKFHSFEVA